MADSDIGKALLENAYRLNTPADNIAYYRDFAQRYDSEFAEALGYHYPVRIAAAYRAAARAEDVPVADIGCGTGLVAEALGLDPATIEGLDISAAMLAIARDRGLYGALHRVDLTVPPEGLAGRFGAVLSAGTFTHGHLGPEPLRGLLQIARPGGLFVIGVNLAHFEAEGFGAVLAAMGQDRLIDAVQIDDVRIYAKDGHVHSDDVARVVVYRKL